MFNRMCVSAMQLTQEATVKTVRSHYLCIFTTPVEQTKNLKKTSLTLCILLFSPALCPKGCVGGVCVTGSQGLVCDCFPGYSGEDCSLGKRILYDI